MKKNIKWQEEVVTKGYFQKELNRAITPLKKADVKLREELHAVEYRLDTKIDLLRAEIRDGMKKQTQIFQDLADKVIGIHNNFEVESVSIRHNYSQLETRVTKVEKVIFSEKTT